LNRCGNVCSDPQSVCIALLRITHAQLITATPRRGPGTNDADILRKNPRLSARFAIHTYTSSRVIDVAFDTYPEQRRATACLGCLAVPSMHTISNENRANPNQET